MYLVFSVLTFIMVIALEVAIAYNWPLETAFALMAGIMILSVAIANAPLVDYHE